MLDQTFTTNSLLKVTGRHEIIKFSLGRELKDYKFNLDIISKNIISEDFEFEKICTSYINSKTIYYTNSAEEHYAIKKISRDLKRLYKINLNNRDNISEQVLRILETSSSYSIIRLDIKSFYESISFDKLLSKLCNDKLLSTKSIALLNNLRKHTDSCLSRGLALSPVLSEIYMRDIDKEIRGISGTYYYARYVDDIIIISSTDIDEIYPNIVSIIKKYNLDLNHKLYKKNITSIKDKKNPTTNSFDYLGYKYIVKPSHFNGKRNIDVVLADDKVRKIKTRLIHSLLDRVYNTEQKSTKEIRLENRIKVLSGNYPIESNKEDKNNTNDSLLKGGIFYSNRLVNKSGIFEEFNDFLRRSLFSKKNNFFGRAMRQISSNEKIKLCQYSFTEGFKNKIYYPFSLEDMNIIKSCWENKNHKRKKR